ncbi:MAG: hypothetical protein J6S67_07445 [Methanobrevibacter sp.]|nr:hypothetical protein [Methanobrevibacter sp.]
MTEEKLQDSIDILSKFTEMLREAVCNQDYVRASQIISAIRYRVSEVYEGIEDKWYNKPR